MATPLLEVCFPCDLLLGFLYVHLLGALLGAILGAKNGPESLPEDWVNDLAATDQVLKESTELAAVAMARN